MCIPHRETGTHIILTQSTKDRHTNFTFRFMRVRYSRLKTFDKIQYKTDNSNHVEYWNTCTAHAQFNIGHMYGNHNYNLQNHNLEASIHVQGPPPKNSDQKHFHSIFLFCLYSECCLQFTYGKNMYQVL